jgi:hypothetical protein
MAIFLGAALFTYPIFTSLVIVGACAVMYLCIIKGAIKLCNFFKITIVFVK